jgi:hypothetical protein
MGLVAHSRVFRLESVLKLREHLPSRAGLVPKRIEKRGLTLDRLFECPGLLALRFEVAPERLIFDFEFVSLGFERVGIDLKCVRLGSKRFVLGLECLDSTFEVGETLVLGLNDLG